MKIVRYRPRIRRGDVIRFRGRWRLVHDVTVREKSISIFMIKVGKSWTDPCISCSYQLTLAEWGAIRIAMRNVPVPVCPVDHLCTASELTECRRSKPPARTGRRTSHR